jgi:hypothetical protein
VQEAHPLKVSESHVILVENKSKQISPGLVLPNRSLAVPFCMLSTRTCKSCFPILKAQDDKAMIFMRFVMGIVISSSSF